MKVLGNRFYADTTSMDSEKKNTREWVFSCPNCKKQYAYLSARNKHYATCKQIYNPEGVNSGKLFKCPKCSKSFKIRKFRDMQAFVDMATFFSQPNIRRRFSKTVPTMEDGVPKWQCPKCQKVYRHRESLQKHLRLECGKDPQFFCSMCPYKSHQKINLQRHALRHIKGGFKKQGHRELHMSQRCIYQEPSIASNVLYHFSSELSSKEWVCENCGKSYSTRGNLARHIKFECGKMPEFQCKLCNKQMHQKGNIIHHLKRSSFSQSRYQVWIPDPPSTEKFPCPHCPKSYRYKGSLLNHMKFECGKEPAFQCHLCDKKMHQKGNLVQHVKSVHKIIHYEYLSQCFSENVSPKPKI
ncbi:gastrula zinc finger protein XlCGF57.1-like [Ctenocephalides felis]|uniref:gastrula zinc finger protein XlCGF57.1-like n=1 Tax=Ctenocephalides felis TaxID=7515 RepID=UPI000E6E2850|nr:gastrula zinc finger protein XlCGF57.1-like [Ctenocephalides felis]